MEALEKGNEERIPPPKCIKLDGSTEECNFSFSEKTKIPPSVTRTRDHKIYSLMLYHLSYQRMLKWNTSKYIGINMKHVFWGWTGIVFEYNEFVLGGTGRLALCCLARTILTLFIDFTLVAWLDFLERAC